MSDNDALKSPRGLVVPWPWLTLSLAVALIACLGTLAVVVSVDNVDTLSTIALALAVLAFAAQLIVSLAQAQGSAEQLTQVERTNSATQSALADVRSTAQALLSNQSEQFNKVLTAALRSATASVVEEVADAADSTDPSGVAGLDPELIAERVEGRLRKLIVAPGPQTPQYDLLTAWAREPVNEHEAERALLILAKLHPIYVVEFCNRVFYPRRSSQSIDGRTVVNLPNLGIQGLVDAGIYRIATSESMEKRAIVSMTDEGRLLIRLMANRPTSRSWVLEKMARLAVQTE
ncbi:hypothetical protein JNW90_16855 [Micromonospora sp. STR1s_5]|nr:hypothetical protein [Micromonospora sp. STR1s_5]